MLFLIIEEIIDFVICWWDVLELFLDCVLFKLELEVMFGVFCLMVDWVIGEFEVVLMVVCDLLSGYWLMEFGWLVYWLCKWI